MSGYGIWQVYIAKQHIDKVFEMIDQAKRQLISQTKGEHFYRPGDNLIRLAFEGLTEMYFGKLQQQWEQDLIDFINEYTLIDLSKKSHKIEKQALARLGRLKGDL